MAATERTDATTITIPVDREHGGLRLAVLIAFIVIGAVTFVLLNLLISSSGLNLLAVLLSFGAAFAGSALVERVLKNRWPSGRKVTMSRDSVRLEKKGTLEREVRPTEEVSVILWTFTIKKRSRVPKGWVMLACALENAAGHLTVYTFMPPAKAQAFADAALFKKIASKKELKGDNNPLREDLRLAGEQRRLRDAENYRWLNGAEMTPDDFITYFERIKIQFSEWMPLH